MKRYPLTQASSPHMRGLPGLVNHDQLGGVLVPAHAGVTRPRSRCGRRAWPRPRTCGGYPSSSTPRNSRPYSSPHMRGLPEWLKESSTHMPLVPAHAGVTRPSNDRPSHDEPRPRTCGGYPRGIRVADGAPTSSPHMRGLPGMPPAFACLRRLVPAHAGVTRGKVGLRVPPVPRPRTCGGYPPTGSWLRTTSISSPHMRGLPAMARIRQPHLRLVPAHAGVTRCA